MALDKFAIKAGIEYTNIDDSTSFVSVVVTTGTIALYPGSTVPAGWVECNGQELPIGALGSQYDALYVLITANGTTFPFGSNTNGSGAAGSTHFRVPDLRGRVAIGSGTGSGLSPRTLGAWGGSQSVTVSDATIAHTHNFPHTHVQPHTHSGNHAQLFNPGSTFHTTVNHTHSYSAHTHPVGTGSNAHTHFVWFGNTGGPGTFSRRLQTTSGPLNAGHVNPAGTHSHTLSATGDTTNPGAPASSDADTIATGATPTTNSGASSAANTAPATGPGGSVSSVSVVQKSYVLKYIMKV